MSALTAVGRATLATITLLASYACFGQPHPNGTALPEPSGIVEDRTALVETGDLDALISRFPERADLIRSLLTGPASHELPLTAVSVYNFLTADQLNTEPLIWDPPGGRFEGDYYVATASPRNISVTIICLVNGQQRDCDERSTTWEADLRPNSYGRFPLSLELEEADRVEVLRVIGGETERFDPASGATVFFAGRRESPTATEVRGPTSKVLGGCDVAAFTSTDSDAENVLRSAPNDSLKFITVEFCEEGDWIVRPILVADGREVLDVQGSEGFGYTMIRGSTFVTELPRTIPRQVDSLQAFVLVDPIQNFHILVSPALKVE